MTVLEIVKREKKRAYECARQKTIASLLTPIIHRAMLEARAEQLMAIWAEYLPPGELHELATALEAAAKGVK